MQNNNVIAGINNLLEVINTATAAGVSVMLLINGEYYEFIGGSNNEK